MSDSARYVVPVSGPAAFVLTRLLKREEVEQRLDAAGFRGSAIREEALSAIDRFAEQGNAWHAAQRGEADVPPAPAAALPRSAGPGRSAASMTVAEAAKALGNSERRVRQLIDNGKLDAYQERAGGPWAVDGAAVETRMAEGSRV